MRKLLLLFFLFPSILFGQTIESISFEGLTRTKEDYIQKLTRTRVGMPYDSMAIENDKFLLLSLNLFFEVDTKIDTLENNNVSVKYKIREAKYVYPIFSIGGFKSQLKLELGVNDINFLGRAQSFGGLYRYYDRHSFSIFHSQKRHSNRITGHESSISKYSTIEPLYFKDTTSIFNFDNYSASGNVLLWVNQFINFSVGGAYFYEDYNQRDDAVSVYGKKQFNFRKHQLKVGFNWDKMAWLYERLYGFQLSTFGEWIHTYGQNNQSPAWLRFSANFKHFLPLGKNGNLASQVRVGLSSNNNSPFSPFVLDGFLNVRGIGNRVERGTGELIANLEYRHTFWRHRIFTIQGNVFADYGVLRAPGGQISTIFQNSNTNLFLGTGLRFHLNVLYKTNFRVDFSFNPSNPKVNGFTFGFGQFF